MKLVLQRSVFRVFLVFAALAAMVSFPFPVLCDETTNEEPKTEKHKLVMRYTVFASALPLTFFYGMKAWEWDTSHDFTSEPEGWFGQDTGFGGADKAGHIYGIYVLQRLAYTWFDYTEDGRSNKWLFSLATTSAVGLAVEIGDGWTAKFGFSWEDLVADAIGIAFAALLDGFPLLDGLIGMSIEYFPSRGYRANRARVPLDFGIDYSGFKYMVNLKPAGFAYLGFDVPKPLRYLTVDLGYYTRGYCSHNEDQAYDYPQKSRYAFVGVSLNVAQMISELHANKNSIAHKLTVTPFEYVHLPLGFKHSEKLIH